MKPKLLDLFCGAGGAAMGYHRVGFEVVGVDIKPQKHYPFEFIQGDALNPPVKLSEFDAIHASPPCQGYSIANNRHKREHPMLVSDVRVLLCRSGKSWVMENVPGAPMFPSLILCGTMFGQRYIMHRLFEMSFTINALLAPCSHAGYVKRGTLANLYDNKHSPMLTAQEINNFKDTPWIGNRTGRRNAIPPAYTEFIGKQLMEHLK